ncbi:Signal transducing adapter molecule 1 [Dirofilaria immitis]|nr:Signal transducing adapter molecule 1 [Dirofilaria immitis]
MKPQIVAARAQRIVQQKLFYLAATDYSINALSNTAKSNVGLTMPIFGETPSPYDESVEKVTAETCTTENWTLILDICDRVIADQNKGAKLCLLSVKKRLNNRDPHVVLLALSLLDSLWSNCGVAFRREVSSWEFSQELSFKATHSNRSIGEKHVRLSKNGQKMNANKMRHWFLSTDPNAVQSTEEEEALVLAIAKSLQETSVRNDHASCVYPSVTCTHSSTPKVGRDVRALYDFEAAEDNELTFSAGDIITVTDDSDLNWWKGRSHRGEGLFPASFVTSNLLLQENEPPAKEKTLSLAVSVARIDKTVLEECLHVLEDCDPTGERPDPPELADLEQRSLAQAPLIDARLAEIDRQHNALAQVDIAIRDVLSMYDRAVQQVHYQVSIQQPIAQPVFRYQTPEALTTLPTVSSQIQWGTAPTENIPL